jgi:3-keto-L-gulonate-6-phosphate decarboxylase
MHGSTRGLADAGAAVATVVTNTDVRTAAMASAEAERRRAPMLIDMLPHTLRVVRCPSSTGAM